MAAGAGAHIRTPYTASCAHESSASAGNPAFGIGATSTLTASLVPLTLGDTIQIEAALLAVGSAYVTTALAQASATVNLGTSDYLEILSASAT